MSPTCFLIFVLLSADPLASEPADTLPRAEAALLHLTAVQPDARREWLVKLEKRLVRANRLNLAAEAAEKMRLETAELLKQKQITVQLLQTLLDRTDDAERQAIGRMAGEYREKVVKRFKGNADEIARRLDAWQEMCEFWDEAHRPFERQDLFLDWLEKAILDVDSTPGEPAKPTAKQPIPVPQPPTPEKPPATHAKPPSTPIKPPAQPAKPPAEDHSSVVVNHSELSARIAGLNLNLRAFETELDEHKSFETSVLSEKLEMLKTLIQNRKDLSNVRDLLTTDEQKYLEKLRSTRPSIAQLGHRIAELRVKMTENAGNKSKTQSELETLDRLSKDLAGLAAE
jgi:hypothetical protein